MTDSVNNKVHTCAEILGDSRLQAKLLVNGDMMAMEAKYHPACLLELYHKTARLKKATPQTDENELSVNDSSAEVDTESLALAEVIAVLEEARANEGSPSVFKLTELGQLYTEQLQRHNAPNVKLNTTRFKDRLLLHCPDLTAVNHGRDVWLTFREHLGIALEQVNKSSDSDAVHLMHTAKLIRNELFSGKFNFNGKFGPSSKVDAVPQTLLTLISMLLEGPENFEKCDNQAAVSISQLVIFNVVKRPRKNATTDVHQRTTVVRHPITQETPLPLYMGLMLHTLTRKKRIVEKCFKLGLSVSYSRVVQISNKVANQVCHQYNEDQLVCPPILRTNLFTVAAADNIDHNLGSNTAQTSFHGTAISLIQFPNSECRGIERMVDYSFATTSDDVSDIILANYIHRRSTMYSTYCRSYNSTRYIFLIRFLTRALQQEYGWLDTVKDSIDNNIVEPKNVTWAGYHAEKTIRKVQPLPIFAMLPLFRHSANTAAMIRHSLSVAAAAIKKLNPQQVPVVTFDQPLYALAKQIQWHWPNQFGEDKFVIMMGGLHIEMAALRMLGHWLEGSGWVQCITQSGVATSGVAESFIHASHVKRTRYAHTVTAAALYICMRNAYDGYCSGLCDGEETLSLKNGVPRRRDPQPSLNTGVLF